MSYRPHTSSLPPPPEKPCAPEEQQRIIQWLVAKRRTGKSLNQSIQQRKDFRNPRFVVCLNIAWPTIQLESINTGSIHIVTIRNYIHLQ